MNRLLVAVVLWAVFLLGLSMRSEIGFGLAGGAAIAIGITKSYWPQLPPSR